MARVNHKKIRQLLNEKRSKITDRQFFTSRIMALHFEDMAMAQTRRYKYNRRIHVNLLWKPKDPDIAITNNLSVLINAGHRLVTRNRGRENRYQIICGLFSHELGHCLFTDFLASQTHNNFLQHFKWYPEPPRLKLSEDVRNEKALWDYAKEDPRNIEMIRFVAHHVSNVLEDGYIESRMLSQFPGKLGCSLKFFREQQWEDMATLTQLIEREMDGGHIFESILQLMLSYTKYGELKYGDEPLSDERVQTIFGLLPELDSAITNPSGKERLNVVNLILVRCWKYIQDYLEVCKQRQEDVEGTDGNPSLAQMVSERLQAIAGSAAGEGTSTPVPEAAVPTPLANLEKRTFTREQKEKSGSDKTDEKESVEPQTGPEAETVSKTGSEKLGEESDSDTSGVSSKGEKFSCNEGKGLRSKKQNVFDSEIGRIPYQHTDRVSEPSGGSVERNDDYERERYDGAATDIERLLDKMAERAACEQLENDRLRELNDVAQGISYGDIHSGVSVRINRISEVDEELVKQYDAISGPLLTISRQLQKSLIQQFKDKQRGGKQTGLLMGRRLDAHALCRNDGKVFYRNTLPNEIPQIAVGLLLDESGSMCACDRCTYARAAAIILYDFCHSLQIPVMVYGHSTGENDVELYSYAEFESIDQNDKYRMVDISARGSNRDGAALRFVAEQLTRRPEEIKLLILVSDGEPAASGYYGSAAEEDLRGIKQEYRRKGILFVAAAIGDDKLNIERIYGDSFLDITDLTQLPVRLTAVVKHYIRA